MILKKICSVLICFLCGLFFFSCDITNSNNISEYSPIDWDANDMPFAKSTITTVLKCLNENDHASLKNLFSEAVTLQYDIDKQIEEAMDFYEGVSTYHNKIENEIFSTQFRVDHYSYKSIRTTMDNVITDNGSKYDIEMIYVLVDEEDDAQIGISQLFIWNSDNPEECYYLLGYNGSFPKSD